ncbi:hypothetical protein [Grimontia sp. AD028]|uniref:hypothetical protein n=1 Tax=Grimontia sp. AD028 TaxID=1581149 RepID=UPI0012E0B520|nr:hypothetical protein [Grimontia sp. AD028]
MLFIETPNDYSILLIIFILSSLSFGLSILLRLRAEFSHSILAINAWKIISIVIFSVVLIVNGSITKSIILTAVIASLITSLIFTLSLTYKKLVTSIKISEPTGGNEDYKETEIFKLQYTYLISFLFFAILGSFDRVLLQYRVDINTYTSYLYLVSMLIFPIGIIGNYVGYRELVFIKKGKKINITTSIVKVSSFSTILFLIYSSLLYLARDIINLEFNYKIWLAVLIVVICKVPYSILSAVVGAKGESSDLITINHFFLLTLVAACIYTYFHGNIYTSIYLVSSIWTLRVIFYYCVAKKYT